jgi:ABC-type polar amino acid transport system ATPase subunit
LAADPEATAGQGGSPSAIVALTGVNKWYGSNHVLRDVSLAVTRGTVVSIVGPSGSGKTTLLRCVNGLEQLQSGTIDVVGIRLVGRPEGKHPSRQEEASLRELRREVAMVFQSFNLFPHLNALQNITLGPIRVLKVSKREAEAEASQLLARVGLGGREGSYPSELSGGEQQRVAIARALAMRPKLLLLDEITSALDAELVGEVLDVVQGLAESGHTMLIVTHELQFAREVADVVVVMDQGRIVELGPPEEVLVNPKTERTKRFIARLRRGGFDGEAAQEPVVTERER